LRVCKKWYGYAHDPLLWRKFDVKCFKHVNLENLKTLIDLFGTESMKELNIQGNYEHRSTRSINLRELDEEFWSILVNKSPNIEFITLEYLNLSNLNVKSLANFKSLAKLSLNWCHLNENWFECNSINSLENLISLKLVRVASLSNNDLKSIVKQIPNLKELTISETKSSLIDDSIKYLANLKQLETLELINTQITDESLREFCRSYNFSSKLTHLNLSMSSYLTNVSIKIIGNYFFNLKKLYLTSCFGLTDVTSLENLFKLNYLNLNNTSVSRIMVNSFKLRACDFCEIEYGHEKILYNKLAWTVNGSRNSVCSF
jgi:hypothetical protein